MLRFIKHNLESIGNVEFFPLFSLLIFVIFFLIVVLRVIKMSKSTVAELSDIPLNDTMDINLKD
ncbi:MAG: CcoQ/FixQ family Cbb3-type cytochrome c oxidase assembly chaperone [Flavobacteriales bacterium]|nr:CcoQ/FixQ family Cbb3-type cytochrome c oxidase assembly chaperone [Crocinitomicaceae bacterium]NBX80702.1 CcoQ/FixQ family Cbb3-type cytochrome c oxidase assembly chaperone [Flavobacteriales bacterium]NCA19662.1 CcoQ/FixQ family Cbb3-type cytochrome c oxidase assembly chaperone [Crocinitomicaceae bacterium]